MNNIREILNLIEKTLEENKIDERLAAIYVWEKYKDPLKLLITIIISVRTREEKTIDVSERLFNKFKDIEELKKVDIEKIKEEIKDIGLYNNKAKWIKEISELWDYNKSCDEEFIRSLPGVGRKVANIYLSLACNKKYIGVDTHVHRVMNRIGIVKTKNPNETEKELYKVLPEEYYIKINQILVKFGRNICKPINPKCDICLVNKYCKYYKQNIDKKEGAL